MAKGAGECLQLCRMSVCQGAVACSPAMWRLRYHHPRSSDDVTNVTQRPGCVFRLLKYDPVHRGDFWGISAMPGRGCTRVGIQP